MQNCSGIKDKVVVITGASSGIGEATALLLAERGAKVVLGARGPNRLKTLAARIADAGGEAAYAPTDVKRREEVTNLVKLACERYSKVYVYVECSYIMRILPLNIKWFEAWENMFVINIKRIIYDIDSPLTVFL